MKLTGKCKEDFEKWYLKELNPIEYTPEAECDDYAFYNLPQSMQYGVYVDFFDNVEYKTKVRILPRVSRGFDCYFTELKECLQLHDTRPQARIEAIKKANENYNNTN